MNTARSVLDGAIFGVGFYHVLSVALATVASGSLAKKENNLHADEVIEYRISGCLSTETKACTTQAQ